MKEINIDRLIACLLQVVASATLGLPVILVILFNVEGYGLRVAAIFWVIVSPFLTLRIIKSIRRAYKALEKESH